MNCVICQKKYIVRSNKNIKTAFHTIPVNSCNNYKDSDIFMLLKLKFSKTANC
jgi:hypothetical protein